MSLKEALIDLLEKNRITSSLKKDDEIKVYQEAMKFKEGLISWETLVELCADYYKKPIRQEYKKKTTQKWGATLDDQRDLDWIDLLKSLIKLVKYDYKKILKLELILVTKGCENAMEVFFYPLSKEFPRLNFTQKISFIKKENFLGAKIIEADSSYYSKEVRRHKRQTKLLQLHKGKGVFWLIEISPFWPKSLIKPLLPLLSIEDLWDLLVYWRQDKDLIALIWSKNQKKFQEALLVRNLVGAKEEREYIQGPHFIKNDILFTDQILIPPDFKHMAINPLGKVNEEYKYFPMLPLVGRFPKNYDVLEKSTKGSSMNLFLNTAYVTEEYFQFVLKVSLKRREPLIAHYLHKSRFFIDQATQRLTGELFLKYLKTFSSEAKEKEIINYFIDLNPLAVPDDWIIKTIERKELLMNQISLGEEKRKKTENILIDLRKRSLGSKNKRVKLKGIFK